MKKFVFAVSCLIVSLSSHSGVIVYNDFSDLSTLSLNGQSSVLNPNSNKVLSLTSGLRQSSSVFLADSLSLDNLASFSAAFDFQITNPVGISDRDGKGADGFTFVVHSNSNRVGGSGGGLGYKGLDNSIAVEIDTWKNGRVDGNDGNHVGINVNGNLKSISQQNISTRMNNGNVWSVWVDYSGIRELLEVRISEGGLRPEDATTTASLDLSDILGTTSAYIGFTSGTGSAGGDHDILNLSLSDDYNTRLAQDVPEPNVLFTFMLGAIAFVGMRVKRR